MAPVWFSLIHNNTDGTPFYSALLMLSLITKRAPLMERNTPLLVRMVHELNLQIFHMFFPPLIIKQICSTKR